jgi:septal ring factor EnvC (AmiA/AmiB activator)
MQSNSKRNLHPPLLTLFIAAMMFAPAATSQAQDLQPVVELEQSINEDAADSQERVSALAAQTQDLLSEFRAVVRETEALRVYNDNLERVVVDQRDEIQSVNRQLEGLEDTNRGVVPLMLEMIDALDRIVEADIPFRIDERRARVQRLSVMMDQAEVTVSEKYRQVMQAYQTELEFGRTTEAYSDILPTTGQTVDFLRVGRTLLVYQTSDQTVTGWFNPAIRDFEPLPDRFRLQVRDGLSIARNERAPALVTLPVPGPEAAQ